VSCTTFSALVPPLQTWNIIVVDKDLSRSAIYLQIMIQTNITSLSTHPAREILLAGLRVWARPL
jgi:hypothetical protein